MGIIKRFISSHKSLTESFISLSALNMIESLMPLVTLPYVLRVIGAANYGIYSYILVIIQYSQLINAYGFNFSATKQIAQNRDNPEQINTIYSAVISCRLLLFAASSALILALSPLLLQTKQEMLMFLMGLGIVLGDSLNPMWLFQGKEKMRYMTIVNASTKIFFMLLIFVFIREADDFVYLILYQSLGYLISGILSIIIAIQIFNVKFRIPTWQEIVFQLKDGFAVFSSTIGINLYRNANIFILKFFVSDAALGIYSAAEKIIKGIQMLTNPIAQALFPHMSYNFKLNNFEQNMRTLKKTSLILGAILAVATVATICAKWLVWLICGEEFMDATFLVRIMSPIVVLGGLNYMLGIVGLINLNHARYFTYSVIVAGLLSVITLLLTASQYGIYAGAGVMLEAESILLICIFISLMIITRTHNKSPHAQ